MSRLTPTELYDKYRRFIYGCAYKLTGNEDLRGVLINEGVIGMLKAYQKFIDNGEASLFTYIAWPIRGAMYDYFKKERTLNKRLVAMPLDDEGNQEEFLSSIASPEKITEKEEMEYIVLSIVSNLPGLAGDCLRARFIDGWECNGSANDKLNLSKDKRWGNSTHGISLVKKLVKEYV